jgi:O-antigen ligase
MSAAAKMVIIQPAELRHSAIIFWALIGISTLVSLASADTHSLGENQILILPKLGILAIPDSMALLTLIGACMLPSFIALFWLNNTLRQFAYCCVLLVLWGAVRGYMVNFDHVPGIGPEARGLFFTCSIMALASALMFYRRDRAILIVTVLGVFECVRCSVEWVVYGAVVDVSHGMMCAATAVVLHAYIVQRRGRAWWLLPLPGLLDVFILTSQRRTPMIILGVGLVAMLLILVSRKATASTRVGATCLLLFVVAGAAMLDRTFLDGQLESRLGSLNLRESRLRGTSNWEHLHDAEDALDLIERSPILGYGTGTLFPNRVLSYAGDDVPFHSPYLHSWVRFGLSGLLAYVCLQVYVLVQLYRVTIGDRSGRRTDPVYSSLGLGVMAYLFGQWALRPWYLDYKQSRGVGFTVGSNGGVRRLRGS